MKTRPPLRFFEHYLGNYQVVAATSPADALRRAEEHKAVAVISSAALDGWGENAPGEAALITCPLPNSKAMAASLGATDVLVKPVSLEALQGALARLESPLRKVLLADDDPDIVRMFRRMLGTITRNTSDHEIQCLEAYTGQEALDLLRAEHPDLALLDLVMPVMSGQEVLRQMAADPACAGIPVIVVSRGPRSGLHTRAPGRTDPDQAHDRLPDGRYRADSGSVGQDAVAGLAES